jgi:hypothetical protein
MNEPSSRVAELIELHLAGEASHAQAEELRQEIASQPELAQHLYRAAWMHGILKSSMGESVQAGLSAPSTAAIVAAPATKPGAAPQRRLRTSSCPPARSTVFPRTSDTGRTSWLAIAACLTVVASALFFIGSPKQMPGVIGTLSDVDAGVTVVSRGGAAGPASAGMPIYPGDVIRTPESGKATLQCVTEDRREATTLVFHAGAEARLWQDQGAKRVNLTKGTLVCEVAMQPEGRPMVVTTPHAEVEVLGTRFRVAASEETHLEVDQGSVRMLELVTGRETIVSSGESALARAVTSAPSTLVTETFDTAASTAENGWSGSGNRSKLQSFGWSRTGLGEGGAAGGIFARVTGFSHFADTTIGTFSRTDTLHMSGSFRLTDGRYDGNLYLGYFNPGAEAGNFLGLRITEDSSGNDFSGHLDVYGANGPESTGGTAAGGYHALLPQKTTLTFDLTWNGNPDGSGTLSGNLAGQSVKLTVPPGTGTFTAFGLMSGGVIDSRANQKTDGCYFDTLTYTSVAKKNQ